MQLIEDVGLERRDLEEVNEAAEEEDQELGFVGKSSPGHGIGVIFRGRGCGSGLWDES